MNAKELMIGDWVCLAGDKQASGRVVELRTDEVLIQMRGDDACDIWGYEDIAPIPLTAKILEKNGLKKVPDMSLIIDDELEHFPMFHYVHELQHALRLCGLDELADNFQL